MQENILSQQMAHFYSQIHLIHVIAVSLSGFTLLLRSIFSILGAKWPKILAVRILVYLIDTILILAAISLIVILPKEIFKNNWLNIKIFLIFIYIMCGFGAMNAKLKKPSRIIFLLFSVAIYFAIIGIAIRHNPLSWFS